MASVIKCNIRRYVNEKHDCTNAKEFVDAVGALKWDPVDVADDLTTVQVDNDSLFAHVAGSITISEQYYHQIKDVRLTMDYIQEHSIDLYNDILIYRDRRKKLESLDTPYFNVGVFSGLTVTDNVHQELSDLMIRVLARCTKSNVIAVHKTYWTNETGSDGQDATTSKQKGKYAKD
ncbi:unnamed protein product [Didymodactylos carnosus]|uniref:Uncharacterized protein n=1 Tax=Didymodactylos carnosus TaxID=1234261 RepID=A0A814LFT1_9BILA|nr:unnamed protein product [Didymodactylos carnosus]CAF3832309.1 unnamed protein product [Didymodactylos carnosus]